MPPMFYLVHWQFLNHSTSSLHALKTMYTTLEIRITIISYHMHLTLWGGCYSSAFKVLQMLRLYSKKSKAISNLVFGYFSIMDGNADDQIEAVLVDIFVIVHLSIVISSRPLSMVHYQCILCSFKLFHEILCQVLKCFNLLQTGRVI